MKIKTALLAFVVSYGFFFNLCLASAPVWTRTSAPNENWNALASSADGIVLVAGVANGPIYVSTDAGATWALTGATNTYWVSAAASADGSQLYAAAGGTFGHDLIYRSTDFGDTWTATGAPDTNWNAVACSADGTKLVAVTGGNCNFGPIFTSTNSGATWTMTGAPITNWWSVASSPDGTRLVAGSTTGGICISTDSGATWRQVELTNGSFWSVTISADGQRLAAAALGGWVYVSSDAGATWTLTAVPHIGNLTVIAGSTDGFILAAIAKGDNSYQSGIYLSTDAGATWVTNGWPDYFYWEWEPCIASSANGGMQVATLGYGGIYTWQALAPSALVAVTGTATGTNGDFVIHGMVNPGCAETWAWFDWDTSPAFANSTTPMGAGSGWNYVSLSAALSGFSPGVAIYYRIAAASDSGLSLGQPHIFQAPLVTLRGSNPLYLVCNDSYAEPGATVSALPVAIATDELHSLALKADRSVVVWGANDDGEFDPPSGLDNVVAIAAGFGHNLALKSDGTVVAWGRNDCGETNVPADLQGVVAIAGGLRYSLALKSDGTVVGWGLGATNPPAYAEFEFGQALPPEGLSNVVSIAAGYDSCLALKSDGTVVGWGDPAHGGTTPPAGLSNVVSIAAGAAFGLALKSDGTVVGWGFSEAGQTNVPTGLSNVVAIAAGFYHSLALKSDGTVVGWGDNFYGGTIPLAGLSNVVAIAAGYYNSLALKSDGTVVAWWWDPFGETDAPTNLICSLGMATASGYVNNYVPGIYPRTYTAHTANGAVGTATRTVIVMSALDARQRLLEDMVNLSARQTTHAGFLRRAISDLKRSVVPNLWLSGMNLTTKNGQNVFIYDSEALFMLDMLKKLKNEPIPDSTLQEWEDRLIKADRLLAQLAIRSAFSSTTPGGGYSNTNNLPKSYFHALNQLTSGDRAAANHQSIAAISNYRNAWKLATDWFSRYSSMQHPPGGGTTPGGGYHY